MPLAKSKRAKNVFCLCGCGKRIGISSRKGYTTGHYYRSSEGRAAMSKRHKGKTISDDQKKFLSRFFNGRKFSESAIKKLSETKRGALNPNWRGGVSLDPYAKDWWTVRIQIRKRDNGKCLIDESHSISPWKHADVHHIDSDQTNNSEMNLISLCRSCHSKTEKKWQEAIPKLHAILADRYSYVYE